MRASTKKFTTMTATLALVAGATLSLSGCFGNPLENLAQGGANEVIKNATGQDVKIGGQSLPGDFPSQIPIVEGEILLGTAVNSDDDRGWMLSIKANDPSAFKKLQSQLVDAGFEESILTEGSNPMAVYQGHGYNVIISTDLSDDDNLVGYIVSKVEED